MQGFILHVRKAKNEDVIATVLTRERIETLYRFYGARHPVVAAGYKIDFEIEKDALPFLPRLRHVIHLGFPWLTDPIRLQVWRHFISLLYEHLKDVEVPGAFYYDLLEERAKIWHLQNPKRNAVEAYLQILEYEGRLHPPDACFICGHALQERISLARAFLPAHPRCIVAKSFPTAEIARLFETKQTIHLDDDAVERLWLTLLEGM